MSKRVNINESCNESKRVFSKEEYDRRPDNSYFERKDWKIISKELLYFKLNEMVSHSDSVCNINLN